MTKRSLFASFLLLSSALVSPAALAQTAESDPAPTETPPADPADDVAADPAVGEEVDVSIPGGADAEIVVTGRYTPNVVRATPEVVSVLRSEEHTSELQSLMRISYAVFCLKKKKNISDRQNT